MKMIVELSADDLKKLIIAEIEAQTGLRDLDATKIVIEVKSKQNYKSEWETADFRARYANYSQNLVNS